MDIAAELAQRMLLAVFRPDDPVLKVKLPPETRQQLEEKLAALPKEIFQADDSLGWVYQFWQRDEKDRVNRSEVEIGADEIAAVTQLFTEDYMVLFLLENTLGAWWTAKRRAEGKNPALPRHEWTYLRLNEDGSPAAGSFDGWPRAARDLRVLDPSMGSGHFLVFALPILAYMRMEEDELSLKQALSAVLKENLFGLEIDARCSQIAAFNLALAAWRMAGEHFALPEINVACSGLGINASEADWVKLAGNDFVADQWMRRLYSMFRDAPTLGSLIDPTRYLEKGQEVGLERVLPLIEEALQREQSDEARELVIAAQGVLAAFRILASRFTLIATNVPYLGRAKQDPLLAQYCADFHSDAKADLATCFADRCLRFAREGGSVALVITQNWLFLHSYLHFRSRLLKSHQWDFVVRLGSRAFETIGGEVVDVALVGLTLGHVSQDHRFFGLDAAAGRTPNEKATYTRNNAGSVVDQQTQLKNPDHRVTLEAGGGGQRVSGYARPTEGLSTGDRDRFVQTFWERPEVDGGWTLLRTGSEVAALFSGMHEIVFWQDGKGALTKADGARIQGDFAWGKSGVLISRVQSLRVGIYGGELFDKSCVVLTPSDERLMPALLAMCTSPEFQREVRILDKKPYVTTAVFGQLPFDLAHWQRAASEKYPNGLPQPHASDPTQWLFNGHPKGSDHPLQVAVARLLGYRWPRQTGSSFMDCPASGPDGLEKHADADGIVPLNAIAGEASAAHRLRDLLADAYGSEWSAAKLHELVGDWDSLEDWLRDAFFEEHCRIFHQRPFVWHVWDGRKDGFHVLVNYHKLAAPNGEGRQTLEKLIYTYLGRWIERQTDEVRNGREGADARLTAATHLRNELEKILRGEKPYDIFVRWKPLHEQPVGWEPDINDGVRLNMRPWLIAKPCQASRRDGCILRTTPRIPYSKDRGKEPHRSKEDFPWFWSWDEQTEDFLGGDKFDGARWNDLHYSMNTKKQARDLKQTAEAKG
ncbi:MAG TPA: DNA methyltransferase [Terriglobales bacterium]|nr:DNA methyltransferase [Terriglobales bacterium]